MLSVIATFTVSSLYADWSKLGSCPSARVVRKVAAEGDNLYAATVEGLYYSPDKGATWTKRTSGMNCTMVMAVEVVGSSVVAGTSGGGAYYTTDKGLNWIHCNLGSDVFDVYSLMEQAGRIYLGCYSGVMASDNNGKSWYSFGLPDQSVECLAGNESIIFASNGKSVYYRMANKWNDMTGNLNGYAVQTLCFSGTMLYAGTDNGLFRTTDLGGTWTELPTYLSGTSVRRIVTHGSLLFAGTDSDGFFFSGNGGKSWIAYNTGLPEKKISAVDIYGDMILVGTANNGVYKENLSYFTAIDNYPPVISEIEDMTAEPGKEVTINFQVDDEDPADLSITVNPLSKTLIPLDNIRLEGSGTDRTMKITPAANKTGSSSVTVTVDDGTFKVKTNFTITVKESSTVVEQTDSCPIVMFYTRNGIRLNTIPGSADPVRPEVFDITGTNVSDRVGIEQSGSSIGIDMDNLPDGVYIVTSRFLGKYYYCKVLLQR